jgi:hypothetical protein
MHRFCSVTVAVVVGLTGCHRGEAHPPEVPTALTVPPGQKVLTVAQATGVQIYECKSSKDDKSHTEWVLKAPDATLFDDAGHTVGKHFGGPTWEALDGSSVVGKVLARDKGPDPSAVAWLLLVAKSHSGNGMFSPVAYVQRVNTVGGMAPTTGCDQAHLSAEIRIPYKASYYFYTASF